MLTFFEPIKFKCLNCGELKVLTGGKLGMCRDCYTYVFRIDDVPAVKKKVDWSQMKAKR